MGETSSCICKVVLIGAGGMAREHGRAFGDVSQAVLAGIWNRTRSRAEALAADLGIRVVCDSIQELYERTRADLAVVAVLEPAAKRVAKECFRFPWTVLLEKPPGLNVPESLDIAESAKAWQRCAFVALNRRFYSSTRTALADLERDETPRLITIQDQEDTEVAAAQGFSSAVLSHWMYANSIHLIDYLTLFGRGEVSAVRPIHHWNPNQPDMVAAGIEFTSGDKGLYSCVWNRPSPWSVSIATARKRWELRPLEQASYQLRGDRRLNAVDIDEWDQKFKPGFREQAEQAVMAALGKTSRSTPLAEAIKTMDLIRLIYGQS